MSMPLVATRELKPIYHSSSRTQFQIDTSGSRAFLSRCRLIDLYNSHASCVATSRYVLNAGAWALIKNITLTSQGERIDFNPDVLQYASLKNLQNTQRENRSLHQMTYQLQSAVEGVNDSKDVDLYDDTGSFANSKSRLKLWDVLPYLDECEFLAGLPDLRLNIEYNTSVSEVYANNANVPTSITINEPTLLIEEILEQAEVQKAIREFDNNPVKFQAVELEKVNIVATTNGTTQQTKVRLGNPQGKVVSRLVFQTIGTSTDYLRLAHSKVFKDEKWNLSVNNRKVLPYQGFDSTSRKSSAFVDSFGRSSQPIGSFDLPMRESHRLETEIDNMNGHISYACVDIMDAVNECELDYTRTGDTTIGTEAITINVWCFVSKTVSKKGKDVVVGYGQLKN